MERNKDRCLEYNEKKRYTDEEIKKLISSMINISNLKGMDIKSRNEIFKKIKNNTGASNRQLSRVTGIGRGIKKHGLFQ